MAVRLSKRSFTLEAAWMKRQVISLSCTHLDVKPLWWDAVLRHLYNWRRGNTLLSSTVYPLQSILHSLSFPPSFNFYCPVFILSAWRGLQAVQGGLRCSRRHLRNRDLAANLSFIVLHLANEGCGVELLSGDIWPEIGRRVEKGSKNAKREREKEANNVSWVLITYLYFHWALKRNSKQR